MESNIILIIAAALVAAYGVAKVYIPETGRWSWVHKVIRFLETYIALAGKKLKSAFTNTSNR